VTDIFMQVWALRYRLARTRAPACDVARDQRCSKMIWPPIAGLRAAKIRSASCKRDAYIQKLRSCEIQFQQTWSRPAAYTGQSGILSEAHAMRRYAEESGRWRRDAVGDIQSVNP
jgi:hypothetical protein